VTDEPILRVEDLHKEFHSHGTVVRAVDGVSFDLRAGETLALVGESGSGKSTTARCVVRLTDPTSGLIRFREHDLATLSRRRLRGLRRDIQMVFQDPHASLNPSMSVRQTLREPLKLHGGEGAVTEERLRALMERVHLDPKLLSRRPDQLSGGQKQRVGIARAVATEPAFVVLDEPTSALDMSLRVSLLALLAELQRDLGMAYLFITHDLSTVRQLADRMLVMHRGKVVEAGTVDNVLDHPSEDYTKALIAAIPVPDPSRRKRPVPA
jgi:ABC-type glutathione transport system ATPase component